jgi:hypothetical protein
MVDWYKEYASKFGGVLNDSPAGAAASPLVF